MAKRCAQSITRTYTLIKGGAIHHPDKEWLVVQVVRVDDKHNDIYKILKHNVKSIIYQIRIGR